MSIIHTDYIFMTMNKNTLRVAVGVRKGSKPIAYLYSNESDNHEDRVYSYCAYLDAFTEEQGEELLQLANDNRTRKAHNYCLKNLNTDNCLGPCGSTVLSDLMSDEWFDGCKEVIDKLHCIKLIGILPHEFDDEIGL